MFKTTFLTYKIQLISWKIDLVRVDLVAIENRQLYRNMISVNMGIWIHWCTDEILVRGCSVSKMTYHRGASLSEQCIADLMFCHGTQTMHNSRVCHCLLFHEHGEQSQAV